MTELNAYLIKTLICWPVVGIALDLENALWGLPISALITAIMIGSFMIFGVV